MSTSFTHALLETSSGYAVFSVKLKDDIAASTPAAGESITDFSKFSRMVDLMSFAPFKSAAHALENANDTADGILNDHLRTLLELNLSKGSSSSKKSKYILAVLDPNLGNAIKESLALPCTSGDYAQSIIRGLRLHASKLLKGLGPEDITKAQLGLGHSYSRSKLKFNVNRVDNMIIQAIALLDQLDKDVNLFSMRVREWYGYHFPELVKFVPDNHQYARCAFLIGDKETLTENKIPELEAILEDNTTMAQNILDAARNSMGASLSPVDLINVMSFASRVVSLGDYRKSLISYLTEKMNQVAPSLTALLGERIGARLISHAGSLTNLSKYPASTVQILGAEKALFRALKTKGNTPKYGLLYHSSFISRAGPKHKGRISRFLANKCSIASRIDCYSDTPTPKFGEALRAQVEERLNFFETGQPPSKNSDAMRKVLESLGLDEDEEDEDEDAMKDVLPTGISPVRKEKERKEKKEKKDKKRKADAMDADSDGEDSDGSESPKKKVKLSKEEKKALKKAAKKAAREAKKAGEDGMDVDDPSKEKKEKKQKREKKEKKSKD